MSTDVIRYDLLVQDALCGVVKKVLGDAAREGLPGDHHFYITFRTDAAGVRLSSRMREKYPDEMTIILQHQFDRLSVDDDGFEVGLSFQGIPERLLIPFDALTGFFDPSVQFGLKFESQPDAIEAGANDAGSAPDQTQGSASKPIGLLSNAGAAASGSRQIAAKADAASAEPVEPGEEGEAKVVSIDAFRKKP